MSMESGGGTSPDEACLIHNCSGLEHHHSQRSKPAMFTALCAGTIALTLFIAGGDDEAIRNEILQLLSEAQTAEASENSAVLREKWERLTELKASHRNFQSALHKIWVDPDRQLSTYERYVLACHLAGFGRPSRLGPNSLAGQSLETYLTLQLGVQAPAGSVRRIAWSTDAAKVKVFVVKNKADNLTFQEILWTAITNHDLEFTVRAENEFFVFVRPEK